MAVGALPVQSDPTLLDEIRRYGKFDPTGCYQCGSCTLSCDLVEGSVSFPRRSIRYALLGLRQPLLESLEPWVCHDCGDCSIVCPRQAEPRISMMTLRRFLSAQYEWTGIASKLLRSRAWYLGSLLRGAFSSLLLILGYHLWYVGMPLQRLRHHAFGIGSHVSPHDVLHAHGDAGSVTAPALARLPRLAADDGGERRRAFRFLIMRPRPGHTSTSRSRTRCCGSVRNKAVGWGIGFSPLGTVMMLTIKVFALRWFQTDNIYPLYHPQRWLGYLAAGFIFYGIGDILVRPLAGAKESTRKPRWRIWSSPSCCC